MPDLKFAPKHLILIALAAILLAAFFWAITSLGAPTVQAPSTLDDSILEARALELAHTFGLQGDPTASRYERMTLAEWNTLIDGRASEESEAIPAFVFVLLGEVSLSMSPNEATQAPNPVINRNNMVIILDARDGTLLGVMSKPDAADLPIALP